ncbi:MAG: NAD(P)H-hydrate dehydratase [Candidatus Omnitrophica bacterium]|nr:NAD(P)H-hydrate dehydratase [Candidatus Omnitrophota bacterium]
MRLPTRLLRRRVKSNKSDFGHIFILAGSRIYSGAAVLCASGALRSGAGLVTLGIPESLALPLIKIKPKEVMLLPLAETTNGFLSSQAYNKIKAFSKKIDILVIGPGLSRDSSTQALARKIIRNIARPMVIDADGLNALAGHLQYLKNNMVLTPHSGEMARLLGSSVQKIERDRKTITGKFARRYKVTLVLKGHHTLVRDKKGKLYINKTGNPGMATAGSGDVLTGMIAAFLGQGLDSFSAARFAVYLHGLAGDLAAREKTQISLIASDIIAKIPEAIKKSS